MSKRKHAPKEPVHHFGGICDPEGKTIFERGCWVIPDHYHQNAPRWKAVVARGGFVITRSHFCATLREMRADGFKIQRPANTWSNLLHFILIKGIGVSKSQKRRRRAGRKAVAA